MPKKEKTMENWREEIQKKLDSKRVIALESCNILTSNDVLTALDVIDGLETDRDETKEWQHIKNLQYEKANRRACK